MITEGACLSVHCIPSVVFVKRKKFSQVCEEPVDLWRNKNGLNLLVSTRKWFQKNVLWLTSADLPLIPPFMSQCTMNGICFVYSQELMYKDPKANSFVFQQYVLETMLDLHDDGGPRKPSVSLLERSIYSARYIFIENLRKRWVVSGAFFQPFLQPCKLFCGIFFSIDFLSDLLTEFEYNRLDRQFQSYLAGPRRTNVDLILYIRTRPEIAHKRIIQRGRAEELSVSVVRT